MIDRRTFCKRALLLAGGLTLPLSALELFDPRRLEALKDDPSPVRWGFLVDTHACVGCGFCVRACKIENDTPYDANVTRTWVERYVVRKDGKVLVDSPKGARDGFTSQEVEQGHHEPAKVAPEEIAKVVSAWTRIPVSKLLEGEVEIDRGERRVAALGVGELVGEMALIDAQPRAANQPENGSGSKVSEVSEIETMILTRS